MLITFCYQLYVFKVTENTEFKNTQQTHSAYFAIFSDINYPKATHRKAKICSYSIQHYSG